jgi:ferredoxin
MDTLSRTKTKYPRVERGSFEQTVLLLQGGGALGSYQAGVYQALAEANLHPDWVAGISIGSINSAIIAGNPPEKRVERLRQFCCSRVLQGPQGASLAGGAPMATIRAGAGDTLRSARRRNVNMRIVIDLNRCQGYAQCIPLAPDILKLHGEEAVMYDPNPDDSQRQRVLRAAASCPVQAIMLDFADKGKETES